jgi:hypothetical protein
MDRLMDALFDLTPQVRYVAVYRHGELSLRSPRTGWPSWVRSAEEESPSTSQPKLRHTTRYSRE